MSRTLWAGSVPFQPQLVVFDKDGTILDFQHLWGGKAQAALRALTEALTLPPPVVTAIAATLGFAPESRQIDGAGPMASATNEAVAAVVAAVLYQHGFPWPAASQAVQTHFMSIILAPAPARPLADIRPLCRQLRRAGVRVGVITNDDRPMTLANLRAFGLLDLVDGVVCADDGLPGKPAPAMLNHLLVEWDLPASAAVVVGDSPADLLMARAAGAGAIGVLSGTGSRDQLAPLADALIPSVADLHFDAN